MLKAGKALVDKFRVEGVGKPIGLDTVIVSGSARSNIVYAGLLIAECPSKD